MTTKRKTFEQMLKAYKEVHKQVMDAKLDDITSVEISEYNNPTQHNHWVFIEVNIGVGGEFVVDQCRYLRINDYNFDKDMADFKNAIHRLVRK